MKYTLVVISLALAACASQHKEAFQVDASAQLDTTSHAEAHGQATDHVEDHGQERTDEAVVTTQSGGGLQLDEVRTLPNGTKVERHFHRDPTKVVKHAMKRADVQKALTDDASSIFDDQVVQTSATKAKVSAKGTAEGGSRPSLGFLVALWPYAVAVCFLLFFVLTGANPIGPAVKLVAWLRKRLSAG